VGRRKKTTLIVPVPHAGIHVKLFVSKPQKKSKPRDKSKFRAARGPESLCKGKESSCIGININTEIYMNKTIATLTCCALLTPLAFAQPGSKGKNEGTTSTQGVTVTGTVVQMTTEEGSAAAYQPVKTLVVREDRSNAPGTYVLNGPGHVLNRVGEVIQTAIKPGTHVRVYYAQMGDQRMVDHVVVD
jgi:hypothetical protein